MFIPLLVLGAAIVMICMESLAPGRRWPYGPVLVSDPRTRAMFDSVARYALCGEPPCP